MNAVAQKKANEVRQGNKGKGDFNPIPKEWDSFTTEIKLFDVTLLLHNQCLLPNISSTSL